jgi:hypothetical protein
MPNTDFKPEFDIKMQGHAIATWTGAKDHETIRKLFEFFRINKWRGKFEVNFPGNGGVNTVQFTEVRRMTEPVGDEPAK